MSDVVSRIVERLGRYAEGVHRLNAPATVVDASLPRALVELYRAFDGGELFHETLVVMPSGQVRRGQSKRYAIGELEGDDFYVDDRGALWRLEKDTDEWLEEGTAIDKWLLGWVESQELLYDDEGEFREDVFDEDGDPSPAVEVARERRVLKRDRAAPAPRWRLARALGRGGEIDAARAELEELLATRPLFSWGWFDMARLTERAGDIAAAYDDARAAAEAVPDYEHSPFFWAHAARLAALRDDERARAECAAHALAGAPDLASAHRSAAAQSLEDDDPRTAEEHARLALALAPRDVAALDLLRRAAAQEAPVGESEVLRQAQDARAEEEGEGEQILTTKPAALARRVVQDSLVVAVGEDGAPAPAQPLVERARDPVLEALHALAHRVPVLGLADQMKVLTLDTEVNDPIPKRAIAAVHERISHRRPQPPPPQARQARQHPHGHVHR